MSERDAAALLGRIAPTASHDRPRGLRPDHRGGVRAARAQGAGDQGGRAAARPGRHLRLQHLDAADHRAGAGERAPRAASSACISSRRWTRCSWSRSSRARRPRRRRSPRPTTTCWQIGKTPIVVNDARGFYTSRTFGTYVMEGCAMLQEGIPAAVIENAARQAGMPVGPLAVIDETSLVAVGACHGADRGRPEGRRQALRRRHRGRTSIVRMVKEFKRPGRAARRRASTTIRRAGSKTLWPELGRIFGKPDARYDTGRAQGPLSLPPGDRDRALPGGGRARDGARRQHRLDLRHRLSGLDRRCGCSSSTTSARRPSSPAPRRWRNVAVNASSRRRSCATRRDAPGSDPVLAFSLYFFFLRLCLGGLAVPPSFFLEKYQSTVS